MQTAWLPDASGTSEKLSHRSRDLSNPNTRQLSCDLRVRSAMDFGGSHLEEPVTLFGISPAAGHSVSRLSSLFREQVGITRRSGIRRR